jgi:hypothetical protein
MPKQQPKKKVNGKDVSRRLQSRHGISMSRANPSDDAEHDQRVRRGLAGENSRAFGGIAARGAIRSRVTGDAVGRRDERRNGKEK